MVKLLCSLLLLVTPVEENITKATVKITQSHIQENKTFTYMGSGTIIKQTETECWILSCDHIIKNKNSPTIEAFTKQKYKAVILATDEIHDLSLLKCAFISDAVVSKISQREKYLIKSPTYLSGFPHGGPLRLSPGLLTGSFSMRNPEHKSFILMPPSISGESGGGVYSLFGELIGVNWGALPDGSRATGLIDIRSFLDSNGFRR